MSIRTDFFPGAERIRPILVNCSQCNCKNKYLQIYRLEGKIKIRCPKCNFFVMEETEEPLIENWNQQSAELV